MPAADVVLLPLCVGLALLGVIATGVAWRRGNRGRVVQGVGLALLPIALYFSGLLSLLWNGLVALGGWASRIIFSPAVWFGLTLLGLCIVLWVVGGIVTRRSAARAPAVPARSGAKAVTAQTNPTNQPARRGSKPAQPAAPVDEDMAEIEAILKSRGIN
ncbi:MAG TPA: hypothetical protein VIT42_13295 [Microlunatus sp.]